MIRQQLWARVAIASAVFLLLASAVPAASEDNSGFTISIPAVRYLDLENQSINFVPEPQMFLTGWSEELQAMAKVSSNVDWVLTIKGTEGFWEGPWSKPVSDIVWKYGAGEFNSLSMEPVEISSGGPASGQEYPVDFKIKLDLANDLPGDYVYTYVIFELSAP